jgi:hypothetical protein
MDEISWSMNVEDTLLEFQRQTYGCFLVFCVDIFILFSIKEKEGNIFNHPFLFF